MASSRINSVIAALVAAVFMGTLGFFVREAGTEASVTTFFRFAIGFLLVGAWVVLGRRKPRFSAMSLLSGVSISLCILFYFMAIQSISIALAAFTLYLGPVFAIATEAILCKKMPTTSQFVIIGLAFGGFVLISSLGSVSFVDIDAGLIYALLSGVFYGGYIFANRLIDSRTELKERLFWQFLAAIVTIGATCLCSGASFEGVAEGWSYLLVIGVVQGFMVLLLTGYAIKHLSAIEFGSLSYVEPLVALILGICLYNELLTHSQIIGIVLIVAASITQCLTLTKSSK